MLALIQAIIEIVSTILGVVQTIRALVTDAAKEHQDYAIETIVTNTQNAVANPTYGLDALHTDLADVLGHVHTIATNVDTIIASINLLSEQVGSPAQNDTAPTWWEPPTGGASPEDIAAAVWTYATGIAYLYDDEAFYNTGDIIANLAAQSQGATGWWGESYPGNPYFRVVYGELYKYGTVWHSWQAYSQTGDIPIPNFANVQENDTALSFCLREANTENWQTTGPGGRDWGGSVAWAPAVFTQERQWFRSAFTTSDLRALYKVLHPPAPVIPPAPPAFPDDETVTYDTPVALVDQLVVDGPLAGVLVDVTTPPTRLGQYVIGGEVYDYRVGEVAFATEDGHLEPWQYLGFRSAIFIPKTMRTAAAAHFRVLAGAGGTVTPFTIG